MEFEEFASLQLDRPVLKDLRTEEQLKKHSLDSNLEQKPIDRALHLLTKGDEIQKLSVIQTLPSLLAGDAQSCITRVIPKMQQTLPNASTEFHMAASTTFKSILEQRLVNHTTFTQTFLQSILNSLDSRDPVVAHAWLETLLDVIELLPTEVIRQEILPMAISKGQLSQPISSRITCCKLLGKICTRFDTILIKKEVLPTVHSLCQDVNSDVRACICLQLRFVAEGLGAESVKPALLPSLVELASDEESSVRHASVQTIVQLLPQFQAETIKGIIAPLIKKLCESALKSEDDVICVIAQEFGRLVLGLDNCLSISEKTWFMKYYQQLAQLGLPSMKKENAKQDSPFITNNPATNDRYVESRRQCAFNFPALCLFTSTLPDGIKELLPTFSELAGDPFYMVRRTIACGIHEVAKVLGAQNGMVKGELIKLLKDDSEEVLQGLVPHLAQTLELLVQSQTIGADLMDNAIMEVGRALLKCETEIAATNNWRLSAMMLAQLETLPRCFPSDLINSHFVPMAFNRAATARPIPVRVAAGRALLVFLRYNLKITQRNEIRSRIYTDLTCSQNCYVRMLFIRMMHEAMLIFSSMYFKEHFYATMLSLTEDPVANIRLKVVTMLPLLKAMLRMPSDKKLLSILEGNVRNLMNNEKDRDVVFALTNVIHKLDSIDIKHEGQPSPAKMSKHENEDLKKFEEEKRLAGLLASKPATGSVISNPNSGTRGNPGNPGNVKKQIYASKQNNSSQRMSMGELQLSRGGRQNSQLAVDTLSKPSPQQQMAKNRQSGGSFGPNESQAKQNSTMRQGVMAPRHMSDGKASTSSNNLTSSWARLASNSMLLTHPWERMGQSSSNTSISSVNISDSSYSDYACQDPLCNCPDVTESVLHSRSAPSNSSQQEHRSNVPCCSCFTTNFECSRSSTPSQQKHEHYLPSDFTESFILTHLNEDRNDLLQNFLLTRENPVNKDKSPDLAALRALTNAAHYNSCWAFSSMPEIPVTLLDDEFLVDAGIRIPAQLSTSQSTSKIPNLQDIICRNRREGSVDRSRRGSINFDKGKTDRHSDYEDSARPRILNNDKNKGRRNSVDYEEGLRRPHSMKSKSEERKIVKEDSETKMYSGSYGRTRYGYEPNQGKSSDEKSKRNSCAMEDKLKSFQPKNLVDRTKRHSANYGTRLQDAKDLKHKFKRHSLEVTDYAPMERTDRTLRRYSTLDVNHNQGLSKIPLRSNFVSGLSGCRTAPVTRASSPIRSGPRLSSNRDSPEDVRVSQRRRCSARFSSSDEEVDKLCQKFTHCQTTATSRAGSPRTRDSRLPVRLRRKLL